MSLRARRFAGARLAAEQLQTIPEQLQQSLQNLREASLKNAGQPVTSSFPDYIKQKREVRGSTKKVELWADPKPVNMADFIPSDLSQTPANIATLEQLVAHPPRAVYDLSWDVDGSYGANSTTGRREAMRIAREAERGWQDIIPKLEDGAIVKNMPYGAQTGDFERADLYMKYGFGPVQANGEQYGQVLSGKIVPISPTMPMDSYIGHLASRAKAGGETELFGQLNANAQALQKMTQDIDVMARKAGGSPDYHDFDYDLDYEEPRTINEQFTREENVREIQNRLQQIQNPGDWDAVPQERQAQEIRGYAKAAVSPEQLTNPVEAPSAQNIQQLRDVQEDLMFYELYQANPQTPPLDVLNQRFPRQTPPMLSADGSPQTGQSLRRPARVDSLRDQPADVRRAALADQLRDRAENGALGIEEMRQARDNAKRGMVDMHRAENGQIGRVIQEQYTDADLSNFRAVQEAAAINESANSTGSNYSNRPFNARSPVTRPQSSRHIFVQSGDRIQNRRALTPEQVSARRELAPFEQAEANILEELKVFEDGMMENSRRGDALRQQRGIGSMQDIIGGARPRASMPGREALRILQQENGQPGTVGKLDLGQALVNLQQIRNNGFTAIKAAAAGPQAIVDQANRGPMTPISTNNRGAVPPNRPPVDEPRRAPARSSDRW